MCDIQMSHASDDRISPTYSLSQLFWCNIQNSWLPEKVKHLSCINKTPWGESCSMSVSRSGRKKWHLFPVLHTTPMWCAPAAHVALFWSTLHQRCLGYHIWSYLEKLHSNRWLKGANFIFLIRKKKGIWTLYWNDGALSVIWTSIRISIICLF